MFEESKCSEGRFVMQSNKFYVTLMLHMGCNYIN